MPWRTKPTPSSNRPSSWRGVRRNRVTDRESKGEGRLVFFGCVALVVTVTIAISMAAVLAGSQPRGLAYLVPGQRPAAKAGLGIRF